MEKERERERKEKSEKVAPFAPILSDFIRDQFVYVQILSSALMHHLLSFHSLFLFYIDNNDPVYDFFKLFEIEISRAKVTLAYKEMFELIDWLTHISSHPPITDQLHQSCKFV